MKDAFAKYTQKHTDGLTAAYLAMQKIHTKIPDQLFVKCLLGDIPYIGSYSTDRQVVFLSGIGLWDTDGLKVPDANLDQATDWLNGLDVSAKWPRRVRRISQPGQGRPSRR